MSIDDKISLSEKFFFIMSAIGTLLASVFFFMYRSEKSKKEKLEVREEVKDAEVKAHAKAEEQNEKSKLKGPIGLASDCADLIDDK